MTFLSHCSVAMERSYILSTQGGDSVRSCPVPSGPPPNLSKNSSIGPDIQKYQPVVAVLIQAATVYLCVCGVCVCRPQVCVFVHMHALVWIRGQPLKVSFLPLPCVSGLKLRLLDMYTKCFYPQSHLWPLTFCYHFYFIAYLFDC